MPQLAPAVLNNGTTDINFTVSTINSQGVAFLVNRNGSVPGAVTTFSMSRGGSEKSGYKPVLKLAVPVIDPITNMVADESLLQVSGRLSPRMTAEERTKLRKMLISALDGAYGTGIIDNLEGVY